MSKIQVKKNESAAAVIGRVIKDSAASVSVFVPRGAKFAESRNSFLLLKREARAAGKEVVIESVDDDILELAATAGLKAVNPFRGKRQRAVSDIMTVTAVPERDEPREVSAASDDTLVEQEAEKAQKRLQKWSSPAATFSLLRRKRLQRVTEEEQPSELFGVASAEGGGSRLIARMKQLLIIAGVVGVTVAVASMLPRVTVVLNVEKIPWNFVGSLAVGTEINESGFSGDEIRLRGVSFIERKNVTKSYVASGKEFVERKAKGTIIVYNAYSSEEQPLVATTRFVTPDGKVYRTDRDIVVPGAKIEEGKIVPSSTTVPVTADKAGEAYNIGPVPRFRIPGFQGTPKYDGFYGESVEPMTGGFVGERRVPTDDDIAKARADTLAALKDGVEAALRLSLPDDITALDGAYRFAVTDEVIDEGASDSDRFTVTVYGEGRVIGFRESELADVVRKRVEDETGVELTARDFKVEYGEPRVNDAGTMLNVAVRIDSVWTRPIDIPAFKKEAQGKNETELKELVFSIPGVQGVEVRFWPIWVSRVPEKESRIIVDVE